MLKKTIFLLGSLFLSAHCCFAGSAEKIIDTPDYTIYVPSRISVDEKYPLVIALSPNASAESMINTWREAAEKYKLFIFASKVFKNDVDMNFTLAHIVKAISGNVFLHFPIDRSKVIATGFSGGGMGSHAFVFLYPQLISAVVINTGMMHEYYIDKKYIYPRGKIAVFLASPTDFRYKEMKQDCAFLESLGWKTKWIEFQGGHIFAPASAYKEAAEWINGQLKR